ncbi:MAG TPA: SRPBCC family protein [Solirubrobacterales bacterium]|nr:SRPBCC family protein [Solirubrobacterales bacterium]
MPTVTIDQDIGAPVERVWDALLDVESYADSMEAVRWIRLTGNGGGDARRAEWSVLLKGSILEWEEEERLDHAAHRVVFTQLRGDLEFFDGYWMLEELGPEATRAHFEVEFEIGIPMLAEMLNPVAQRALEESCAQMLRDFERSVAGE